MRVVIGPLDWKRSKDEWPREGSSSNAWADRYWVGEVDSMPEGWAQVTCIWAGIFRLALSAVMRE